MAVLNLTGQVQVWHVYALAFMLGVASAVDFPARQAFTVEMVEGKDDLTNAIALNSAMFNMARAVGPALAGVIVAATGEGIAFLLNGLTFVAVIISLIFMRNLPRPVYTGSAETNLLAHMSEGVRFIGSQQYLTLLISIVAVSSFLSMPYATLMPVFADVVLKKRAAPVMNFICGQGLGWPCTAPQALPLGMLLGAVGIGAVIGALYIASMPANAQRGRMLTIGTLGFPSVLILFSISRSFLLSLGLMLLLGFIFTWQNALANTMLQIASPDEMRGRVMSFYTLAVQASNRLGGLQAGYVADWLGAPFSLGIGSLISLMYGIYIAIKYPWMRRK
jgi:predicted MFS family arabinose efflux permease